MGVIHGVWDPGAAPGGRDVAWLLMAATGFRALWDNGSALPLKTDQGQGAATMALTRLPLGAAGARYRVGGLRAVLGAAQDVLSGDCQLDPYSHDPARLRQLGERKAERDS